MAKNPSAFFPLFFSLPLFLSIHCFWKFKEYRNTAFLRLSEFFLSLVLVMASTWLLMRMGPAFIILSMFPWIWLLRTSGLVCSAISGQTMVHRAHFYVLGLGGLVSIVFLSFDYTLAMVTAPFALSVGLIGVSFILQSYSRGKLQKYSLLHHFNLCLFLLFYVYRLAFPLMVSNGRDIQIVDTYFGMLFCISLYPLFSQMVFEGQVHALEKVLETRNQQLFGHSGFSEYRVLSAGLSHEVNNALTIINAKITRLILGRSTELDKDLHVIQNSANRITRSVRALRDFIYPTEIQEVIDLGEVIDGVLVLYGQRLLNHNVTIDHEGLKGRSVRGQRVQLEQIFLGLINNSVDGVTLRPEKWIKITGHSLGDSIEIIYQDSSLSHADEVNALLSDPLHFHFEFKDNEIRLVLAKEITQKYGGTFESLERDFSTYRMTFPLASEEDATLRNGTISYGQNTISSQTSSSP